MGLFGTKCMVLPLENADRQEVFLSKTNSVFTGKLGARYSTFKPTLFSFDRLMCFFNSAE
jgi:hypothetical protein